MATKRGRSRTKTVSKRGRQLRKDSRTDINDLPSLSNNPRHTYSQVLRKLNSIDMDGGDSILDGSYDILKNIEESTLRSKLFIEYTDQILFDSLMRIYSKKTSDYIDIAGILTRKSKYLYLTSPMNYYIWEQFRDRSKIDEVMDDYEEKISENVASQLMQNLNITDDEKICNNKIQPFLLKKSRNLIKRNILTTKKKLKSISQLFGVSDGKKDKQSHHKMKTVNCVSIGNIECIKKQKLEDFKRYLFDGISIIDNDTSKNSKVIKLHDYHPNSIIPTLNKRANEWLRKNVSGSESIKVTTHAPKPSLISKFRCKMINLQQFDTILPFDTDDLQNCFILNGQNCDYSITLQLSSNNQRHEWITYLDYAMQSQQGLQKKPSIKFIINSDNDPKQKMVHDFTENNNNINGEYVQNFNFGRNLNYWDPNPSNGVMTKYHTFKEELLQNKYSSLSEKQYYVIMEQCIALRTKCKQQIQNLRAHDIGSSLNHKKYDIPIGTPISINHLIALKLYTDHIYVQMEFKKHCKRYGDRESLKDFIERNSEIAHWCRYIKECCMFYGELMPGKMRVYVILKHKLLFKSMQQVFECPISTTTEQKMAEQFADGRDGVVLLMKRANPRTRYAVLFMLFRSRFHEFRPFVHIKVF